MVHLSIQSLLLAALALARPARSACDRATLKAAADTLVAALKAGDPSAIAPVSDDVEYTEQMEPADLAAGIFAEGLPVDHDRTTVDTTLCKTYTEQVVAGGDHPCVVGTQLTFAEDGSEIVKVETLVTDRGDWLFNAANTLKYALQEDEAGAWGEIPEADRDARDVIQAAADAYLDLFDDKSVVVPWGDPCWRLEGGTYMGPSCNVGVPSGLDLTNRRYVVDETTGSCDVFLNFGGPNGAPDSHEFRITKGKITNVHTITVM